MVVEADWPDAYRVNRYVQGIGEDADAGAALSGFVRFPGWMWRNVVVQEFVEWLSEFNSARPAAQRVGFYGMDLYSLYHSIGRVLEYLRAQDPEAAERAQQRYECFDHAAEDPQRYGYAASVGASESCEREAVAQLVDVRRRALEAARRNGMLREDEGFDAEQNARVVVGAEAYYRGMFGGRVNTWNLRDRHMVETLGALKAHLTRRRGPAPMVVWAHNSHLGDARATEMCDRGELNVGQLVRERFASSYLLGFTTHYGTVSAASRWDGAVERKTVLPSLEESHERVLHEHAPEFSFLPLGPQVAELALPPLLERAIGVIYRPQSERMSHYFHAHMGAQFDGVVHVDETSALEPLEPGERWHAGEEAPETWPTGL